MPGETVVVIDFADEPQSDYAGIKVKKRKGGAEYKYLVLSDNKGALEVDFGRIKEI